MSPEIKKKQKTKLNVSVEIIGPIVKPKTKPTK